MEFAEVVREHFEQRQPLAVRGGNSRTFLGNDVRGDVLDLSSHIGVLSYEPKELVVRVRAGTALRDLIETLAAERQILGFEPPVFSDKSTIGGAIASGLSGPRRPWYGAARDFVLGVGLVTGEGKYLEFGGQVMKNVAGFDVSRLVTGAMGTLGVIADVSLKVLPAPEVEQTLVLEVDAGTALDKMIELSNSPLPVSGLCYLDQCLYVRFSGTETGVSAAVRACGGEQEEEFEWRSCGDLSRFEGAREIWRISVPPASTAFLEASSMIDWGGAQRWIVDPSFNPRDSLDNGHATLMVDRDSSGIPPFTPLPEPLARVHKAVKAVLDPAGILNPGRMYTEL